MVLKHKNYKGLGEQSPSLFLINLKEFTMRKIRKVRSNHNSLFNYFIYDEKCLSKKYVSKCVLFLDNLSKRKPEDCFKMENKND